MAPEIEQFWTLLAESQLLSGEKIEELRATHEDSDASVVGDQLVQQKILSPLQASVLLAGHSGPFVFGRYVIRKRLESRAIIDGFQAFGGFDRSTGHSVRLDFYDGKSDDALEVWADLERQVNRLRAIEHPNLIAVYQTIALPDRRFLVTAMPIGKTLSKTVPLKSRLKPREVLRIVTPLVEALEAVIDDDAVPVSRDSKKQPRNALDVSIESLMDHIWIGADRVAQLSPVHVCKLDEQQATFLMSALILRLATGRSLKFGWNEAGRHFSFDVKERDKRIAAIELDEERLPLKSLLRKGLAEFKNAESKRTELKIDDTSSAETKTPDKRSIGLSSFRKALDKLSSLEVKKDAKNGKDAKAGNAKVNSSAKANTAREKAYLDSIEARVLPAADYVDGTVPEIDTMLVRSSEGAATNKISDQRIQNAQAAALKRKQAQWKMPAAVAGGIVALGLTAAIWALSVGSQKVAAVEQSTKPKAEADHSAVDPALPDASSPKPTVDDDQTIDLSQVAYVQQLIDDDLETLWESPTSGLPIDFFYLPSATEIIVHLRAAEFLSTSQGPSILSSLGPDWETQRTSLEKRIGVALDEIDSLTVAFVPDSSVGYQSLLAVSGIGDSFERDALLAAWGQPDKIQLASGQTIYATAEQAWLFVDKQNDSSDGVRFVTANPVLIQQIAQQRGAFALADPLANRVGESDRDRHVTLMALSKSLTNENASKSLGAWKDRLLPALRLAIPDGVRALSTSIHIDGSEYVEWQMGHSADITRTALIDNLRRTFARTTQRATEHVDRLAKIDYWDRLRSRFGKMLALLNQQTRWAAEFEVVRGNSWLPPHAIENIVASSELALSFADAVAPADENAPPEMKKASTFEELLAVKRSLNVANPPDLNVLLSDIEAEVVEDFPQLPFEFKIKLMGTDLRMEGITQNQRPGPLAIANQPLAAILTGIMTSANPDKTITGPADPNCKLVWVLAEDPGEPGKRAILITTRAAAAEKGYSLPAPFVEK